MKIWLLIFALLVIVWILLSFFGPLRGSTSDDFKNRVPSANSPLKPCPDSPNCINISTRFDKKPDVLFNAIQSILKNMDPYKLNSNSQSLQIKAVFRIPVFGFKDDLQIILEPDATGSILHLRSASRVGKSDLGVNRRRVQKILTSVKQNL